MAKKIGYMLLVTTFVLGMASPAAAISGEKVFKKCKACHSLQEGKNKMGPSLHGLFGRKAGTVPKYRYSKALKNSGIVWSEETLDDWLSGPKNLVKKTKMRTRGLKEEQRKALIEYLKSLQPELKDGVKKSKGE